MTIQLDKEKIDLLFLTSEHQGDALLGLYQMVYPDVWNQIEHVNGWPKCNKRTWKYICGQFQQFDREYHPNVMPGGLWLNNGFSTLNVNDGELEDFQIIPAPVSLVQEKDPVR